MPFAIRRKKKTRISDDQALAWELRDRELEISRQNAIMSMAAFDKLDPQLRKAFAEDYFNHNGQTMVQVHQFAFYRGIHAGLQVLNEFDRKVKEYMDNKLKEDLQGLKAKLERSFKGHV